MKKLLLLFILISPLAINAQECNKSIGLRGGDSWGFTYRICSDDANAEEALLSFRNGGMQFTVMKEKFMPVLLKYSEHIFLYKGYGGHLGYSKWRHKDYEDNLYWQHHSKASPLIGIDGVIGLEYRLFQYPFSAGIEFKPFIELGGHRFFRLNLWDFGFTVKYNLKYTGS
ncbi:MAG: hypothetical protein HGB12_02565 [Bacteroidetes bacterium]|nr:hypothetical protein [Bacteroidota bacterium]